MIPKLRWWERFLLCFKRRQYAYDFGFGLDTVTTYKMLFNRIYMLSDPFPMPPQHVNCRCVIEPVVDQDEEERSSPIN